MKANGIWVVTAALVAGCSPLVSSYDTIAPRAFEEKGSVARAFSGEIGTRVTHRRRALPEALDSREVEFGGARAMELSRIAARLSEALRAEVVIEDRGDRPEESIAKREPPAPIPVAGKRRVGELLDEIALRSDYDWEWEESSGPETGRLILYRDLLRSHAEAPAAGWGTKEEWRIDPVRHGTLRGVLTEWTARAGWTLVWEAEEVDYAVRAPAVYLGTFDAAVDALLRETKGRRMLVPTLWRANRYLTVREAG